MASSPYFVTTLNAEVRITPNMLNNNIIDEIRQSLEYNYLNKCYKNYGYIEKIYYVDEKNIKNASLRADDLSGSAIINVNFNCRLCNPIENTIIIAKITGINNVIMKGQNNCIKIIISCNDINKTNIQLRNNMYYSKNKNGELTDRTVVCGSYVNVRVVGKKIKNKSGNIFVLGFLESLVDDDKVIEELKKTYEKEENVDAEELISSKKKNKVIENERKQSINSDSESSYVSDIETTTDEDDDEVSEEEYN